MALNNGGGALDFDKLDELIDSVNSYGGKKYLAMNKAMRRQLNALARATVGQGVYNVIINNLEVLGYGEAGGTSSIYCCTFGDQAVTGMQAPPRAAMASRCGTWAKCPMCLCSAPGSTAKSALASCTPALRAASIPLPRSLDRPRTH